MVTQFALIFVEGLALVAFSRIRFFPLAVPMLVVFSTLVQSSEGSTFALVPFLHPRAVGVVAGIVGASGNIGAVCWGLLFKSTDDYREGLLYLGFIVMALSFLSFLNPIEGTWLHRPTQHAAKASDAKDVENPQVANKTITDDFAEDDTRDAETATIASKKKGSVVMAIG